MENRMYTRYLEEVAPTLTQGVRLQESDAGAYDQQDYAEHRGGRGN